MSRTRACSCRTSCRPVRSSSSRCRACGRRRTPRCAPPSPPIPRRPSSSIRRSRSAGRCRKRTRAARRSPTRTRSLWALSGPRSQAVRAQIGLDQVEIAMTGAAPIPFEILQFFRSLGVPLSEVYGLSETSGPMTWTPFRVKVGTVGPPMPGVEVVLDEDGEVLTRGGNVFRGYLNAPEQTADVFDADGWFHTGDIGVLDDGRLSQDRRPQEGADHHRGRQEHLAGQPRSRAQGRPADRAGVRDRRQPAVRLRAAGARPRGRARLGQAARHRRDRPRRARRASRRAGRSRSAKSTRRTRGSRRSRRIKRWTLLADEWLPDSEELTPTMKLKRRGVHRKYADEIAALYA